MDDFLGKAWQDLTIHLPDIKNTFFSRLHKLYTSNKRYYHNLNHIGTLLKLTDQYQHLLKAPGTIRFAVWYHDAIYNATKNNNEEKSAELAKKHLSAMKVGQAVISDCYKLIIATKKHEIPNGLNTFDAKFLLDIDLSILAAPQEAYLGYTKQIRKEYSIYPDFMYKKGRKKVLQHFLNTERIFKTDLFFDLNEKKARQNLALELHQTNSK